MDSTGKSLLVLFNSLHYVVFFPLVAFLYFALPFRYRWLMLLASSYYFYMCWRPEYAILIVVSTAIDYLAGLGMGRTASRGVRRWLLLVSMTANLGLLFSFKYLGFFSQAVNEALSLAGTPARVPVLELLLPVGISFYTFQSMSYAIDVYRGIQKPERNFLRFALYVSFFPQLVAGPIERSTHLLPQFRVRHEFSYERMRSGLTMILAGMFKKVVIADRLAVYVDAVYNNPSDYEGLTIVVATYLFAFQIFCDFSGYTDIAIGSARILGYDLMENFRRPYFAHSMTEFWRRWHISLSTWMRDYLYVSLGGNRISAGRTYVNIFVTFLLSGLWHGANWTFLVWGSLHGVFLVVGKMTRESRRAWAARVWGDADAAPAKAMRIAITFHLTLFAWVFFRANSFTDAIVLIHGAITGFRFSREALFGPMQPQEFLIAVLAIMAMEAVHVIQERGPIELRFARLPMPVRWCAYYTVLFAILLFGVFTSHQFIYFQF